MSNCFWLSVAAPIGRQTAPECLLWLNEKGLFQGRLNNDLIISFFLKIMSFFFLCLAIFVIFFQPSEIIEGLESLSLLKIFIVMSLISYFIKDNNKNINFLKNFTNKFYLLFIICQTISAASLWIVNGINILNIWSKYFLVYYLINKIITDSYKLYITISIIVISIVCLSCFSVANYIIINDFSGRAIGYGWFANANDLSNILVSVLPLTLLLFDVSNNNILKFFYICASFLFSFNILLTGSRNGLLGLFFVGSVSIFILKISKLKRVLFVIILSVSIVIIGLTTVLSRDDLSGLAGDESSENRLVQWVACIRMVKEHPFFGVGPFESTGLMRDFGGIQGLPPHNTIIQSFAETGIIGGLFFLIFSFSPIYRILKNLKNFNNKNYINLIYCKYLLTSLIGFWITAFFSNRMEGHTLYILVALSVAAENIIFYNNSLREN